MQYFFEFLYIIKNILYSLEVAPAGIGLHVNARKTKYMCSNQTGDISTLGGSSLKLVHKFIYIEKQCLINRCRHRHAG